MASPISPSVGLGSGLDITSIVTALVNADKTAAQTQITNSQATNTMQLSGVGSLKSALTTFQTALTNLGSTTTPQFAGFSATSGTPSTLTATTDNTAVAGSYNITVNALATSSQIASASFSGGASSAIPSGTLTISQNGTNYNVTIPANATLQSTRDAINSSLSGNGISANIVTDSSGASRLVFGSTTTGAGSDLSVSGIAGLQIDGTQVMSNPPTATSSGAITATAQNASLTVNGLTVTSTSNTVSGAVSGMTLNLLSAGTPPAGASSTVTVGTNSSGLQSSIQTFVNAYNSLMTTIGTLTTPSTDANGNVVPAAFTADSMPRSLISSIRGVLTTPGSGGQLAVLSQLGVGTDPVTGSLNFNTTTFNRAMTTDGLSGQVQTLFTGTTANSGSDGVLARMTAAISSYVQTGGLLDQRTDSLNTQASSLTSQQAALDLHVTNMTATLTAKYNAMDTLVGQLKATSSSITSFFASLTAQQSAS
ncbi:flagellar filament capping protein FliD [Pseudomonas gingeri]|uniref:flagellar filament capping protein FliD n=1 Tax=Pseudomonas gingeri TaxID=117681 RepID=UPI0015A42DFA|nr:flagellar filament capping protein FliD [Pseudomonas gingeri]NWA26272.1 flagellar filament capping protein FliD [Pseudomonas gingeri]NWD75341.1 flagellar filament capping protein FliD [Pseudomonas gingeri]